MTVFYLIKRHDKSGYGGYSAVIATDCHSKKFFDQFGLSHDVDYYNLGLYAFKQGNRLQTLNGICRKRFSRNKVKSLLRKGQWTIIGTNSPDSFKNLGPKVLQDFQLSDEIIKSL